jgi:hypothetical protein
MNFVLHVSVSKMKSTKWFTFSVKYWTQLHLREVYLGYALNCGAQQVQIYVNILYDFRK